MIHFFKIEGKIDAYDEERAIEKLYDLLFNQCEFKITITGVEDETDCGDSLREAMMDEVFEREI